MDLTAKEIERFHRHVDRGPNCWEWTGETNNKGYGRLAIYRGNSRKRLLAHRAAYFLTTGIDPGARVIRHSCDNPPCVRGDHLMVGTQADNILDAVERGRTNVTGLAQFRADRLDRVVARIESGWKTCGHCGFHKPFGEFSKNRTRIDGRQNRCKECVSARRSA